MTVPQLYVAILFAAAGAVFCALQLRRAIRATRDQDRADARAQAGLVLDDHAPGINTGWQDICKLIWDLPANTPDHEIDALRYRLWDAILDRRKEDNP